MKLRITVPHVDASGAVAAGTIIEVEDHEGAIVDERAINLLDGKYAVPHEWRETAISKKLKEIATR